MSSASTQYCPNCGESNPIDAQTCWNCGQALPTPDERQALWSTRDGNETAGDDAESGDGTANRPGDDPRWSSAATEPFTTPDRDATSPAERPAETPRSGDTRTYPSTWGAPATDSSSRRRALGDRGSYGTDQPTTAPPAGPGQGPTGYGQAGYGPSGYGPGGTAPDEGGYPGQGQSGPTPGGYGQGGYPAWSTGAGDPYAPGEVAGQPGVGQPGWGQPGPYGPEQYAQGPWPGEYGPTPYGPQGGSGVPVLGQPVVSRRPSGCLLGALGLVLIALVGAVLVALVAYDAATGDGLRDGLREVAATEVTQIGPVEVPEDGRLTVSEADVNRTIRRYTDQYGAISDPTFAIDPGGVVLNFSVLGIDSSYQSGLVAEGGQLRLTDPAASGAAARVLDAGDMVGIVEPALNDILRQSGVTAARVELGDGELTVVTSATAATPTAGTPLAVPSPRPASSVPPAASPPPTPRIQSTPDAPDRIR